MQLEALAVFRKININIKTALFYFLAYFNNTRKRYVYVYIATHSFGELSAIFALKIGCYGHALTIRTTIKQEDYMNILYISVSELP